MARDEAFRISNDPRNTATVWNVPGYSIWSNTVALAECLTHTKGRLVLRDMCCWHSISQNESASHLRVLCRRISSCTSLQYTKISKSFRILKDYQVVIWFNSNFYIQLKNFVTVEAIYYAHTTICNNNYDKDKTPYTWRWKNDLKCNYKVDRCSTELTTVHSCVLAHSCTNFIQGHCCVFWHSWSNVNPVTTGQ
jgi:hypothetical protein